MKFWGITALFITGGIVYHADAQATNATCMPEFDWMTNSRGQSPCLLAAYLRSACLHNAGDAYISALPEGFHYSPPTALTTTPCTCSTVYYSVISACGACQNRTYLPWTAWRTNCSPPNYIKGWPKDIQSDTSIPAWAYLDVISPDAFNISTAKVLAFRDTPESPALRRAATSTTDTGSESIGNAREAFGKTAVNFDEVSYPYPPPERTNPVVVQLVSAAIGILSGAGVFVIIIVFLGFLHGRNSRITPSAIPAVPDDSPLLKSPSAGETPHDSAPQESPATAVYNSSEPSTFPQAVCKSTDHPDRVDPVPSSSQQQATGEYRGVPEV